MFSIISHHLLVNLVLPDYELSDVKDCVLFFFLFSAGCTLHHTGHTNSQQMFVKMSWFKSTQRFGNAGSLTFVIPIVQKIKQRHRELGDCLSRGFCRARIWTLSLSHCAAGAGQTTPLLGSFKSPTGASWSSFVLFGWILWSYNCLNIEHTSLHPAPSFYLKWNLEAMSHS